MRQLPLEVRLADYALFETYYPGPNAAVLHSLNEIARNAAYAFAWLWGPGDVGKSHLLQACANAASTAGSRAVYLPLGAELGLMAAGLDGIGECDVVCIDNIDRIAGDSEWERALLLLFESVRQAGGRMVVGASRAPLHMQFALPDLVSRFTSGATFRLQTLSDEDKRKAMQLRASWRGLELPDEVAQFVMLRVDRSSSRLFELLDQLDRESLAAQKKLTVPFVRSVLRGA
jgi:DnaA family protein